MALDQAEADDVVALSRRSLRAIADLLLAQGAWLVAVLSFKVRVASRGAKKSRGSGRAGRRGAAERAAVRGRPMFGRRGGASAPPPASLSAAEPGGLRRWLRPSAALGAAAGKPLLAAPATLVLVMVRQASPGPPGGRLRGLAVATGVGIVGATLDFLWNRLGVFHLREPATDLELAIWLFALWFGFATTLGTSLAFLARRPLWSALLGGVCGPLVWAAGERLRAVRLPVAPASSFAVFAATWGLSLPLLLAVAVPPRGVS